MQARSRSPTCAGKGLVYFSDDYNCFCSSALVSYAAASCCTPMHKLKLAYSIFGSFYTVLRPTESQLQVVTVLMLFQPPSVLTLHADVALVTIIAATTGSKAKATHHTEVLQKTQITRGSTSMPMEPPPSMHRHGNSSAIIALILYHCSKGVC
jgi:hypothetical protein